MPRRPFHWLSACLPALLMSAVSLACACATAMAETPPLHREIDALIGERLTTQKVTPAARCDDATFVRRLHLDLTGIIPTAAEARAFIDDPAPDKRARLIDALLASPAHAIHLARVFDVMLLERRSAMGGSTVDVAPASWRAYLAGAFAENRPWNQMAREILGGDGLDEKTGAAVRFYIARNVDAHQLTRDVGRLFLGMDLQCAQCHDDPRFSDYRQADYYGLYAFLERSKIHPLKPKGSALGELGVGETKFTSVFTAKSGSTAPKLPGSGMIADPVLAKGAEYRVAPATKERPVPVYSRRQKLAEELPKAATDGFAANLANRLWAHLLGRGLVHPLDLRHAANPPSHPALLSRLEQWTIDNGFNIRALLREIALSETYQRASLLPAGTSGVPPEETFAVAGLRGLSAESFRWSVLQATGRLESHLAKAKAPPDWQARLTHLEALERPSAGLLAVFSGLPGQPESGFQPTVDQALHLLNSAKSLPLLEAGPGTLLERLAAMKDPVAVTEELYLAVLSRRPSADESAEAAAVLTGADRTGALKSLLHGLLLSAEFRLNH